MSKKITWEGIKQRVFKNWLSVLSLPLTFLLIDQIRQKAPLEQILPTVGGIIGTLLGYDKKKQTPIEVKKAAVKQAKAEIKSEVTDAMSKVTPEQLDSSKLPPEIRQ